MSCSKPISEICVFDQLKIRGGSYALYHKGVQWHPDRDDCRVQQFLANKAYSIGNSTQPIYYSFAVVHPYLGPSIRIEKITIHVGGDFTYVSEHIEEMEKIAYLWRDGDIKIENAHGWAVRLVAEDFQLILNSPTILRCRVLEMDTAHFSFKDYKVLRAVQVIRLIYGDTDPTYLLEFLEQPGVKPDINVGCIDRANIANVLERLCKAFSSAVVKNPFKLMFSIRQQGRLTEFQETNKTSDEKLELKDGHLVDLPNFFWKENIFFHYNSYTLERSSI